MAATRASESLRCMGGRSIRVLVEPPPLSFAERRSVLQVLEQHGPVEVFKRTPGYSAVFTSVTKKEVTARRLVASSPLSYSIPVARTSADTALDGPQATPPSADAPRGTAASEKCFRVEVYPDPEYRHRFSMASSPLCQPWPSSHAKDRSFIAATLKQSLPRTIAAAGLAHWLLDLDKDVSQSCMEKRLQMKRWLPSKMKALTAPAGPQSNRP